MVLVCSFKVAKYLQYEPLLFFHVGDMFLISIFLRFVCRCEDERFEVGLQTFFNLIFFTFCFSLENHFHFNTNLGKYCLFSVGCCVRIQSFNHSCFRSHTEKTPEVCSIYMYMHRSLNIAKCRTYSVSKEKSFSSR